MKKNLIITFFLSVTFAVSSLSAQDFEFRFIDKAFILNHFQESDEAKKVKWGAQDFYERSMNNLSTKRQDFDRKRRRLEYLEGKEHDDAYEKLVKLNEELNAEKEKIETTTKKIWSDFYDEFLKKVDDAIQEIVKKENIDYVIPTTDEEDNLIIYYVSAEKTELYDITSKVMDHLNSN